MKIFKYTRIQRKKHAKKQEKNVDLCRQKNAKNMFSVCFCVIKVWTHHLHTASTHPHFYPNHLKYTYFSDLQKYPKCIIPKVIYRRIRPLFSKTKNTSKNCSRRREAPKMMLLKFRSFMFIFLKIFKYIRVQRPKTCKNMKKHVDFSRQKTCSPSVFA